MNEEITAEDLAKILKVTRNSAVQRLYRLTLKHQAVRLNMPSKGAVCRYKLLVPMEKLIETQKYRKPPMSREVDWKKFCADPFGMAKKKEVI
jgi:hypothetical protein